MEKRIVADFALGAWELDRVDLKVPPGAVDRLSEAYIDEAGVPRGRGRVLQKISTALGGTLGVFGWAGTLLPGRRGLVIADSGGLLNCRSQRFDPAGSVFSGGAAFGGMSSPTSLAVVGNTLWIGCDGSNIYHWGGSLKTTQTMTSCARTAGSRVITRAAGGFITGGLFDVGMVIRNWSLVGGGPAVVASIDSDTQITMDRPSPATDVASFTFWATPAQAQIVGTVLTGKGRTVVGSVAGRVLLLENNRLVFSRGVDPSLGQPRTDQFQIGDVHEFPVDAQGIAMATLRDRVLIFTEAGNFAVSGMAYEITDGSGTPQHPIEQITGKSVALSQRGIVTWQGALIVPCRDGIYVIDGYGAPVLLSRGVPWAEMVRGGLEIGFATIYKERYILPYRYGGQTHQYVFRTDGRDTDFGTVFSTSQFSMPPNVFSVWSDQEDSVIAVGDAAGGVLEAGEVLSEIVNDGLNYDATAAAGAFSLVSGPLLLGDKAVVRRVRVRYTWLNGTTTATPELVVRVYTRDGNHLEEKRLAIDTNVPATRWVALDLSTPAEGDVVQVSVSLAGARPSGFALHAFEVHYRAWGGS